MPLLRLAASRLMEGEGKEELAGELKKFRKNDAVKGWLKSSALFEVLNKKFEGQYWWEWPAEYRDRKKKAMKAIEEELGDEIEIFIILQFLFNRQWNRVHDYANKRGIQIIGDMPIYVGGHSADVWANRKLFTIKSDGSPDVVGGCPPDAFSATGQLWGNPLYDWNAHKKENYAWWGTRLGVAGVR